MKNRRSDFDRGYMDVLMNITMCVMFLFVVSITMIAVKVQSQGNIVKNADFVIEMEWPPEINCDIDLWVQDPTGQILYYGADDIPLMNLDRDDLGYVSDVYSYTVNGVDGTPVRVSENKEIATLRGVIPGQYAVNSHVYSCHPDKGKTFTLGDTVSVPVTITISQINPTFRKQFTRKILFTKVWEEQTVTTFMMSDKKEASEFRTDAEVAMVEKILQRITP